MKTSIPSLNYHLWRPCNMRCKFCFATFQDKAGNHLPKGHLPREDSHRLLKEFADHGFQKINFAGGEPTLCPWLSDLITQAKGYGMTTSIVTNGTGLTDEFLRDNVGQLDWIGLSVDSVLENTNLLSGRALLGKKVLTLVDYCDITDRILKFGYRLKINTVVGRHNVHENMADFIRYANPERWKLFQALPIQGQNDQHIADFAIDGSAFQDYVDRHANCSQIVVEDNIAMTHSYVMVDPGGKFYTESNGAYRYSEPILDAGCHQALAEMDYNRERFIDRGGLYR